MENVGIFLAICGHLKYFYPLWRPWMSPYLKGWINRCFPTRSDMFKQVQKAEKCVNLKARRSLPVQGCQIFLGTWYQNWKTCTKWTQNVSNGHDTSQMSIKYSKWQENTSPFSYFRPSKIYPNWDFWFENKPPGNPVPVPSQRQQTSTVARW
jgi:hypothetical protein